MPSYVCDFCGWQSDDRAATVAHLRDAHQVNAPADVGSIEQDAGLLILRDQNGATALDLSAEVSALIAELGFPLTAAGACGGRGQPTAAGYELRPEAGQDFPPEVQAWLTARGFTREKDRRGPCYRRPWPMQGV